MKLPATLPIILDGGMGRELERIGAPFQQPEWSAHALIESPHYVSQVHRNFINAGAEIITTNTYALVPFHIGEKRFKEQGADLIKLAAKLARDCVNDNDVGDLDVSGNVNVNSKVLVAGCIPPVLGSYRPDLFSVTQAKPLLEALIVNQEADIDFWLAETISSIEEAAMIKARTAQTIKPTWIAFTVKDEINTESRLRSGETVFAAVSQIAGQHVSAILFNCSAVEVMESVLINAKQALLALGLEGKVQLGVYANNFPPIGELREANNDEGLSIIRNDISPIRYREFVSAWINAGASIVGGCCGVSPDHIKKLSELKKL
ncbi:homocysteine S-methyltransferase family protein [Cognaticolwellia beringensis]|uniref:Homocysteine S-methyltransferase family protein n=1 Tax=Cognaticolwellia beringensis TaxID=1967665 RepID=A0A222GCN7_9GAMM|nr:homocysteine S-methyltransferase family protein [Cognaticolwellia beringensis]ASP49423.1 homocysteine S-methyltransferase family protein [Cognaticolwellia beringensis]